MTAEVWDSNDGDGANGAESTLGLPMSLRFASCLSAKFVATPPVVALPPLKTPKKKSIWSAHSEVPTFDRSVARSGAL